MRWKSEMKRPRRVRSPGMVLGTRMAVSMTLASSSPAQGLAAGVQLGGPIKCSCLTPQSQIATRLDAGLHTARGRDDMETQGMLSAAAGLHSPERCRPYNPSLLWGFEVELQREMADGKDCWMQRYDACEGS